MRSSELLGATRNLAVAGAMFSAVLMAVQFGVVRAFCPLCTASAIAAIGLLITSTRALRDSLATEHPGDPAVALALATLRFHKRLD